jgi:steroid 5-alpha reductase family enzyme
MVCIWGLRLGSFLVLRINWYGRDPRFDEILPQPKKFLLYWMIQGVWVIVTSLPAHFVNFSENQGELGFLDYLGLALWGFGLLYESAADYHKFYFRLTNQDKKDFVKTGLWKYSRHPNYFGEILLWWGVFIVALSGLEGLQLLCFLCPAFVTFLLTRVSGVSSCYLSFFSLLVC